MTSPHPYITRTHIEFFQHQGELRLHSSHIGTPPYTNHINISDVFDVLKVHKGCGYCADILIGLCYHLLSI